jgi:hypothetical protein
MPVRMPSGEEVDVVLEGLPRMPVDAAEKIFCLNVTEDVEEAGVEEVRGWWRGALGMPRVGREREGFYETMMTSGGSFEVCI